MIPQAAPSIGHTSASLGQSAAWATRAGHTGPASDTGGAVIVMEQTAHHQDLRAPCAADPPELTRARAREEVLIRGWIATAAES